MLEKRFRRARIIPLVATMLVVASISAVSVVWAQTANTISMKNFDFSPMSLTVKAGTTVSWKNLDEEPHTVTSDSGLFRSGALDQNETFTFRFDKPGTYKYLCSIHPQMVATITVQ